MLPALGRAASDEESLSSFVTFKSQRSYSWGQNKHKVHGKDDGQGNL